MPVYRLTRDATALSTGFHGRAGQAIPQGAIPPALLSRWLESGVLVEEGRLALLRERAKAAGIDHYWSMSADTLEEKLHESNQQS